MELTLWNWPEILRDLENDLQRCSLGFYLEGAAQSVKWNWFLERIFQTPFCQRWTFSNIASSRSEVWTFLKKVHREESCSQDQRGVDEVLCICISCVVLFHVPWSGNGLYLLMYMIFHASVLLETSLQADFKDTDEAIKPTLGTNALALHSPTAQNTAGTAIAPSQTTAPGSPASGNTTAASDKGTKPR